RKKDDDPCGHGNSGDNAVHGLRYANEHPRDLEQRHEHHGRPSPDHPAHPEARSGHSIDGIEPCLRHRDGVAAEKGLHYRFDQAGKNNQPHHGVSDFCAQSRGQDQFAGADDRRGQHHAWSRLAHDFAEGCRRFENVGRVELVWIEMALLYFTGLILTDAVNHGLLPQFCFSVVVTPLRAFDHPWPYTNDADHWNKVARKVRGEGRGARGEGKNKCTELSAVPSPLVPKGPQAATRASSPVPRRRSDGWRPYRRSRAWWRPCGPPRRSLVSIHRRRGR